MKYNYNLDVNTDNVESNLTDTINDSLSNIDFGNVQDVLDNFSDQSFSIFGEQSFLQKLNAILSGDMGDSVGTFLLKILDLFFGNVMGYVPIMCVVVGIAIIGTLITNLKSDNAHNVDNIVNFVCFALVITMISTQCIDLLHDVQVCINSQKLQMDSIFPILLTMLASLGGSVSVGLFQTSTAILSNVVVQIFSIIIIPLFLIGFVFSILGNLIDSVRLSKFNDLIGSILKWVIGIVFGVFGIVLTIQGIVAGSFDGMSINAAKFALKSYIPVLGGYLSDGFNYVLASGTLIKNAVGFAGLLLLLSGIIPSFVRVVVFAFLLKLAGAMIEPIGNNKIANFLIQISKLMFYMLGILLVISFMYILTMGLIMCVANVS